MKLLKTIVPVISLFIGATYMYTKDVEEIQVLPGSLIDLKENYPYKDSFKMQLNKKTNVKDFTTQFFQTDAFKLEKLILTIFTNPKPTSTNFDVGNEHLMFYQKMKKKFY